MSILSNPSQPAALAWGLFTVLVLAGCATEPTLPLTEGSTAPTPPACNCTCPVAAGAADTAAAVAVPAAVPSSAPVAAKAIRFDTDNAASSPPPPAATPAPTPAAAAATTPAAAPAESEFSLESGFYVKVGVFAVASNGQNAYQKLAAAGLPAIAYSSESPKGSLMRIRVGPFPTRTAALGAAQKVKALKLEAVVVRY